MNISQKTINELEKIDARGGLEESLFLSVSALVPIANVDLLILNDHGQILLARREDSYFGYGWHIPGGCIRFKETMKERAEKTALCEIGMPINIEEMITVKDVIIDYERDGIINQNHRAHHLAVLFRCSLAKEQETDEYCEKITKGDIKWFDYLPADFLKVHDVYLEDLDRYGLKKRTI